jgi:spore germination cell wall hydrolase CwlJ-like protein
MKTLLLILTLLSAKEFNCAAEAVYYEAGNQSFAGKVSVAQTIRNRAVDGRWPDTVCGVVRQKNQFSYYWDGKPERIPKHNNKLEKLAAAESILAVVFGMLTPDQTKGAVYYHTKNIKKPHWAKKVNAVYSTGDHIFYADYK